MPRTSMGPSFCKPGARSRLIPPIHALLCLATASFMALSAAPALCAEPSDPDSPSLTDVSLDKAISRTMDSPEYTWRLPRERPPEAGRRGAVGAFLAQLADWIARGAQIARRGFSRVVDWVEKVMRWISRNFSMRERAPHDDDSFGWQTSVQTLMLVLLAISACMLVLLAYRFVRRKKKTLRDAATTATPMRMDILSEDIMPDERPSDEWMNMAMAFLDRGELRLAARALFLACLAHLAGVDRISLARHKSNREYAAELIRHAHNQPDLLSAFTTNIGIFEKIWYGDHVPEPDSMDAMRRNQETILMDRGVQLSLDTGGQ